MITKEEYNNYQKEKDRLMSEIVHLNKKIKEYKQQNLPKPEEIVNKVYSIDVSFATHIYYISDYSEDDNRFLVKSYEFNDELKYVNFDKMRVSADSVIKRITTGDWKEIDIQKYYDMLNLIRENVFTA